MTEREAKDLANRISERKDKVVLKCKESGNLQRISYVTYVKCWDGTFYVQLHLVPSGLTSQTDSVRLSEVREKFEVIAK